MKWIGQHIWDFVSRFRNDIYLEDISDGTVASDKFLGLDSNNKLVKEAVSGGAAAMNDLTDADTTTDAPDVNEVLKWNGTNWIPALYNASFTFSVATNRVGGQSSIAYLIGDGQYVSSQTHAITYNNSGTFSTAPTIAQSAYGGSADGTTGGYPLTTTSNGAAATSTAINYPTLGSNGYTRLRHTVTATFGGTTDNNGPNYDIYFRNKKFFGQSTNAALTSAQIQLLSNSDWCAVTEASTNSDVYTHTDVTMPSSNGFMYYCYPARISGTPVIRLNGFPTTFTELAQVEVTNANGYVENYKVWKSPEQYDASFVLKVE